MYLASVVLSFKKESGCVYGLRVNNNTGDVACRNMVVIMLAILESTAKIRIFSVLWLGHEVEPKLCLAFYVLWLIQFLSLNIFY